MIHEPQNRFGRTRHETATAEELLESFAHAGEHMPHDKQAEQALLSAIFQDPARLLEVRMRVPPQAFYSGDTRAIYEEMLTMDGEGLQVDAVTMSARLRDQGKDTVAPPWQVTEIATLFIVPSMFTMYLRMVLDRWTLRKGIHGHLLAVQRLFRHLKEHSDRPTLEALTDAGTLVQLALDGIQVDTGSTATLKQCLDEHVDHMTLVWEKQRAGEPMLIPTGFPTLDSRAGGIGRNEYWLITGPTKSGKSVSAGTIVKHAARLRWRGKIYTNEITRVAYAGRFLASESEQFNGTIERLGFTNEGQLLDYQRAVSVLGKNLGDWILIDNAAGKYVEDIVADMRMEARQGVSLFVIDLIGKLRTRAVHGNRERELAHISNCLSDATKILNVACLVVAQENDEGAVRESKALSMDCECWLKLLPVYADEKEEKKKKVSGPWPEEKKASGPQIMKDRRNLVVQVARGFASGDVIPCVFDGPRFLLREMSNRDEPEG